MCSSYQFYLHTSHHQNSPTRLSCSGIAHEILKCDFTSIAFLPLGNLVSYVWFFSIDFNSYFIFSLQAWSCNTALIKDKLFEEPLFLIDEMTNNNWKPTHKWKSWGSNTKQNLWQINFDIFISWVKNCER